MGYILAGFLFLIILAAIMASREAIISFFKGAGKVIQGNHPKVVLSEEEGNKDIANT